MQQQQLVIQTSCRYCYSNISAFPHVPFLLLAQLASYSYIDLISYTYIHNEYDLQPTRAQVQQYTANYSLVIIITLQQNNTEGLEANRASSSIIMQLRISVVTRQDCSYVSPFHPLMASMPFSQLAIRCMYIMYLCIISYP